MSYKSVEKKTGLRYPAINDLIAKADNKYQLVLATAKRAREIVDGSDPLVKIDVDNPVSIATKEISEDLVRVITNPVESPVEEETVFPEDIIMDAMTTEEIADSQVDDIILE